MCRVASPLSTKLAPEHLDQARSEGVNLVRPAGLFTDLTEDVLETALEAEMSNLRYGEHDPRPNKTGLPTRLLPTPLSRKVAP